MVIMQDDFSATQAIGKEENGYAAVASTYKDREIGYVFHGTHIGKEGWRDWNKELTTEVAYYGEYNSTTPDGRVVDTSNRVAWSHILGDEEAGKYTLAHILGPETWYEA